MSSLLVTNDFPPKVGGIQSYLYELWRRLPPDQTAVLTTPFRGARSWDAEQAFRVERTWERVLFPTPSLSRRVDVLAREVGADLIVLDPTLPLARIGRRLSAAPYLVVVHGAEVTVPSRLPGARSLAASVLADAAGVIAAGQYPARQASELVPGLRGVVVPPGVDTDRFRPADPEARKETRRRFGLPTDAPLVLGVSRLVPRKGFDVLLDAAAALPGVHVAIAGAGRDRRRLARRAASLGGRVHLLGRVSDDDLPALYGCADAFAMLCRDRWGGLEAEGFGIVFLEAAACGIPAVAGRSGGSHEAVLDGETGFVVEPRDVLAVRTALRTLLEEDATRVAFGNAARVYAQSCSYDVVAPRLAALFDNGLDRLEPLAG